VRDLTTTLNSIRYRDKVIEHSKSVVDRFWAKVDKSGGSDACWLWIASRDSNGYGAFKVNGKKINAHRYSLSLQLGRMPNGLACHSCDNRQCVNPQHLHEGTHQSNMDECRERGRTCKGVPNTYTAKLSAVEITAIDQMYRSGKNHREIAEMFDISRNQVGRILRREQWKHIRKESKCL